MDSFEKLNRNHVVLARLTAAFSYALAVAVALNFFWRPGHIYSSGVTGFAQIIESLSLKFLPFVIPTSVMYFVLNLPIMLLGWVKIGPKFTAYTVFTVVLASFMMKIITPVHVNIDPLLCAIFGGVINGFGTGLALKSGISTGGLDIIGIVIRQKTGTSYGKVNIMINLVIVIFSGFIFGWTGALYTALNIFINGRIIDAVYNQHQKLQMMIVTEHPQAIITGIQDKMHRGITEIHDVEGAFAHTEKTILITIIDRYDLYDINQIIAQCDPYAFVSVTQVVKVYGRFKEQELV